MSDVSQFTPYNYSVKIMNPKKRSEFEVVQLKTKQRFETIADLKHQMLTEYADKISNPIEQLGYIEPGHGLRGKQRWISLNDDLYLMYSLLKRKPYEVTPWCFAPLRVCGVKRPSENTKR